MLHKRFVLTISSLYIYLTLCIIPYSPPLLRAFFAFPATLLLPGVLVVLLIKSDTESLIFEILVEGFFISTLLNPLVTYFFYISGISLIPKNYAVFYAVLCTPLILFIYHKKKFFINTHSTKTENYILATLSFAYILLFLFFYQIPRFFTPDETSYIFKAYLFVTTNTFVPVIIAPHETSLQILFLSRTFWIMLLASYIASTGITPSSAGLLSTSYLVMFSLTPSLILDQKRENLLFYSVVFLLSSPMLLVFAGMILNDLAIAFYIVLSCVYFIKSFSYKNGILQISIKELFLTLLTLFITILIKPNILIVGAMWFTLTYLMIKSKFYRATWKNKIIFYVFFLFPLLYELVIDIPYVIAVWLLRNSDLGAIFRKFIVVSFAERFLSIFIAPWWDPTRRTIFYLAPLELLKRFYRLLMPESNTIIVSAIVLLSPFLLLFANKVHLTLKEKALALMVSFSFWSFFLFTYAFFSDIPRYSLWMVPLWITLTLMIIYKVLLSPEDSPILLNLVLSFTLLILLINILIQHFSGGIIVGYGIFAKTTTYPILLSQLGLITFYFYYFLHKKKSSFLYIYTLKLWQVTIKREIKISQKTIFRAILLLLLLSNLYFSYFFVKSSVYYENHGINAISAEVNAIGNNETNTLLFANNYIYLRPYLTTQVIRTDKILPPPDTSDEWELLFNTAPIGTKFVVSNDKDTTWYGYGDYYLNHFVDSDVITPPYTKPTTLALLKFPDDVLYMPFDDANETRIPDHSIYHNDGLNVGVSLVDGYYGKAINFTDASYILVPNSESFIFNESLSLSFFAIFTNNTKGKVLLISKGNALSDGTFSIFLYNNDLSFYIGEVGGIHFTIDPYLNEWHHYVFAYNGKTIMAFVDGYPVAQNNYSGKIRNSFYSISIGDPMFGKLEYFTWMLDELQISKSNINYTELVGMYYSAFAIKQKEVSLDGHICNFYTLFRKNHNTTVSTSISATKVLNIDTGLSSNSTWQLNLTIFSNIPTNITLLISTDRFTKFHYLILSGSKTNIYNFSISYPFIYESNKTVSKYWSSLSVVKIILIENGQIIFQRNNITHFDFDKDLVYFTLMLFGTLFLYLSLLSCKDTLLHILRSILKIRSVLRYYPNNQNLCDMFLKIFYFIDVS